MEITTTVENQQTPSPSSATTDAGALLEVGQEVGQMRAELDQARQEAASARMEAETARQEAATANRQAEEARQASEAAAAIAITAALEVQEQQTPTEEPEAAIVEVDTPKENAAGTSETALANGAKKSGLLHRIIFR